MQRIKFQIVIAKNRLRKGIADFKIEEIASELRCSTFPVENNSNLDIKVANILLN